MTDDRELAAKIDAIMEEVDEAFCAGEFDRIDRRIAVLDLSDISPSEIVTWLTTTGWAREKLPSRPAFVERCERRLVSSCGPERTERLLNRRR